MNAEGNSDQHIADQHIADQHIADQHIASTPPPPYTAVIFRSIRSADAAGYEATAAAMEALAAEQPGYLGIESSSDGTTGLTVSYWVDANAAAAWKRVGGHLAAQRLGTERWYSDYIVRVATVDRDYRRDGDRDLT